MSTLKEKIAVMQAFEDALQIAYRKRGTTDWYKAASPSWDWVMYDYQITPNQEKNNATNT